MNQVEISVFGAEDGDQYCVKVVGEYADGWDEYYTMSEQDAIDEAHAIADDIGGVVVWW